MAGCADRQPHRAESPPASMRLPAPDPHPDPLSAYFHKTDRPLEGGSAFYSLTLPSDALAARLFLIDHAQNRLDLQYYIYENDTIGSLVTYHLIQAANRGVKVRLLLDDISTTCKDAAIVTLARHPNIEVRLFNPNRFRSFFRNFALLLGIETLGKRMHNKALVADDDAAIVGGRNIADIYYAGDEKTLFLDYDVLAIGGVVGEIAEEYETYWNSREAVPVKELIDPDETLEWKEIRARVAASVAEFHESRIGKALPQAPFYRAVRNDTLEFIVADGTKLYYDPPDKVVTDEKNDADFISRQIDETLKKAKKEIIVISPYFIPSQGMLRRFKTLRKSGVRVVVVTNSLASTDVFPVYSGYYKYIGPLVRMGVELYELKPEVLRHLPNGETQKPPTLSLHTKLVLFDDERMAVGSANIDPRSEKLNTELVLFITSKKLTTQKKRIVTKLLDLEHLYRLSWDKLPKGPYGDFTLYGPVWETMEKGKRVRYYSPPKASMGRRVGAGLLRLLPIEGYL